MSDFNIKLLKSDSVYDLTKISSGLSWKSSIDTLGVQLDVTLATSNDRFFPSVRVALGDKIILTKGGYEIFRGIITDESIADNLSRTYVAFDFAFYLNKSKTIIQFNDMRADKAIRKLCSNVSIPIDNVPNIPTKFSGIYKDKSISEILFEILKEGEDELANRYFIEMVGEKLSIGLVSKTPIEFDISLMGTVSISRSISELKNSIISRSKNLSGREVIHKERDPSSIIKFGLLEDIENIDNKDISKIRNITKNNLKKKNKQTETLSVSLLGDETIKSGMTIFIEDSRKHIKGNYLIKECTHNVDGGVYEMSLSVEAVE